MKRAFLLCLTVLFLVLLVSCTDTEEQQGQEGTTPPQNEEVKPTANIDVLKIGKADCIIINTGSNILMIDTGEWENLPKIHSYMKEKGYTQVDTLIITHYDKDHIGGAEEIIELYGVKTVYETKFTDTTDEYLAYHNSVEKMGASLNKLEANTRLEIDGCSFDILVPMRSKYTTAKDNNQSLVVSMECANSKLLFCGDAMELRMAELLIDSVGHHDLVKLPHHGTYLQNYPILLDELTPQYCVATDSNKNPIDDTLLDLLTQREVDTYTTKNGTVSIKVDSEGITLKQ